MISAEDSSMRASPGQVSIEPRKAIAMQTSEMAHLAMMVSIMTAQLPERNALMGSAEAARSAGTSDAIYAIASISAALPA
jgi:hypothetical protein